jgi:hypothetical protein
LRGEALSASIETACAHCDQPLHIEVDGYGEWSIREHEATPLLFEPQIDWERFSKPHIIDDF